MLGSRPLFMEHGVPFRRWGYRHLDARGGSGCPERLRDINLKGSAVDRRLSFVSLYLSVSFFPRFFPSLFLFFFFFPCQSVCLSVSVCLTK